MPDQDDIDAINSAIVENAQRPNRTRFGQREVQQHSLGDQVKAAQHIAGSVASDTAKFGLRFTRLVPPGCG
jgi:hypothetical protein